MTAQRNLDPRAAEVLQRYNNETLPDFCQPLTGVNQVGTFGNRPIHLASYRGKMADVLALVEAGADVNVQGDLGSTPLHEAAEQGHAEVVQYLLAHGASAHLKNELGETPLDVARAKGRSDIVEYLLNKMK